MQPTPHRKKLAGKVTIVTGASAGIGQATALAFGQAGARVVLAARRVERLEQTASEIRSAGGQALVVPTDLSNRAEITRLVVTTLAAYGRIDILANIAGWGRYDWFEEFDPEDLRKQYEVNVIGMAELIRQVLPTMQAQRSGHIINMSSYASRISIPPLTVYASTKYAVEGLSDGLRRELLPWGIQVSRVHPSGVKGTEFNKQAAREGGIRYQSLPIGKITREKLAREVVALAERPRRELFISRLYDPGVWMNRRWPGLVDLISAVWVWRKRRTILGTGQEPAQPAPFFFRLRQTAVLGMLAAGAAGWLWLKERSR